MAPASTAYWLARQMLAQRRRRRNPPMLSAESSLPRPQWNNESIGHSNRPNVAVTDRSKGSSVARQRFPAVIQVVVHTEFCTFRICARQTWVHTESTAGMKNLRATNHLNTTKHSRTDIAEAKRPLHPQAIAFRSRICSLRSELKRYAGWLPLQVKSVSVEPVILKLVLCAHSDLKAFTRKKHADAYTRLTFGIKVIYGRERRKIDRIIQRDVFVASYAASEHQSVVASRSDGKNQRIRLGVAYPIGIESFVEDVKGSEEPACRDRDISVRDAVEFHVVKGLVDRSREITRVSITALEVALEGGAGFKNQIAPKWHQQDRRDDRYQCWIAAIPGGHKRHTSRKHGNGFRVGHKRWRGRRILRHTDKSCHKPNSSCETTLDHAPPPFLDIMPDAQESSCHGFVNSHYVGNYLGWRWSLQQGMVSARPKAVLVRNLPAQIKLSEAD